MGSNNGTGWQLGDSELGAALVGALQTGYNLEALQHRIDPLKGTEWGRIVVAVGKADKADRAQVLDFCLMELPPEHFGNRDPDETEDIFRHVLDLASRPEAQARFLGGDKVLLRREQRARVNSADVLDLFDDLKWIWKDWIPKGFLSMVAGRPKIGKSGILLDLASQAAQADINSYWPDTAHRIDVPTEAPRIMWIDCEQTHQLLFIRMKAWNIDPAPFFWPSDINDQSNKFPVIRLNDPAWGECICDLILDERPMWVIIDSLRSAFRGDENSSECQTMLDTMAGIARDTSTAITFAHHLRKAREREKVDVVNMDQIRGSGAIVAAFRSIIAVDKPDPNDPHLRMSVINTNLCKEPQPIGFALGDNGKPEWTTDAPQQARPETSADRAEEWLRTYLQDGEKTAQSVFQAAADEGHSKKSLYDGKRRIGVVQRRSGFGEGSHSVWRMP